MTSKRRKKSPLKRLGNSPTQRRDVSIARAYARGVHREDLAEKHGLSVNTISAILWRAGGRALRA